MTPSPPPFRPDMDIVGPKCRECGRDLNDPKAHWHDLCYPVTARILLACALLAGAFAVYAMFTA